jgi:TolB-like protein
MFDRLAGLLHSLRERRIFRYVVAYAAASWAALEVVDQLVGNQILPAFSYRATLSLVLCGFPGALIVSWFHGAKGRQEIPAAERWLLLSVGVFALATTAFIVRSDIQAMDAAGPGFALAPTEDPRRVAVLYFEPRGGPEAEFLASGLTESLIEELSGVQGLHVVSRNGSRLFRDTSASPDSIGRTLQVGSLVDGIVSQVGDRIRVDVSLVAASSGEHLASKRLEGARSELFELQDELGDTVAVFLRREIGTEMGSRTRRAATASLEAWERAQEGGQMVHQASLLVASDDLEAAARSLRSADSLYALAEQSDPEWVEPVVRRGWTAYQRSRLSGLERFEHERWIGEGLEHARRALVLGPEDPGALELQATLLYWRYLLNLAGTPSEADDLFHRAENGFRRAISAAGGDLPSARNSLSHLLLNKGAVAEAKLQALQAYESDPFLENAHLTLWRIFSASWSLQDAVEAARYCREGATRFPRDVRFRECQIRLFALPGVEPDIGRAWALVDEITDLSPPQLREFNRRRGLVYLSMALVRAALPDSARAVAVRARAGSELDPLRELAQLESITWTWLGDTEEALRQLSLYFAANPGAVEGYRESARRQDLPWYHHSLLTEPRFRELVGVN